jgi:NADH:ubiquinone oxidoreductase subunit K
MNVEHLLLLSIFLFSVGIAVIVTKRNAILILIGIELLLNAANLNLVTFNQMFPSSIDGQMFGLFVIIVAVCETGVGLAIIMQVYKHHRTSVPDEVSHLKE